MKSKYILWPFFFIVIGVGMTAVVMLLWNWLMPEIFGLKEITFWQALGILILGKILFGGFHGKRGYGGHPCGHAQGGYGWKHKFKSRWENMSEEDRRRWEEKCGSKWGNYCPDDKKTADPPKS